MGAREEDVEQAGRPASPETNSERTPLLGNSNRHPEDHAAEDISSSNQSPKNSRHVAGIISVLLIGVFVANADGSLVLATAGTISSQFSNLSGASWLTTSYAMAMCAAQPVVGKMSDIFGRKGVLLCCYTLFALGSALAGIGQTMWQVILGRAVSGLGGAGMVVIVSILITDLVPMIEVASWRSYVNVVATTGRSLGGPLGGMLADSVGWRWSFIGQVPFMMLAFALLVYKLEEPTKDEEPLGSKKDPRGSKFGRVDFVGAILISSTIVSFLFAIDIIGGTLEWQDPLFIGLLTTSVVLAITFFVFEAKYAREPIFPPSLLLQRDVLTAYVIGGLQTGAQLALMFSVPLFFQVADGVSNTKAGSHLVPAVLGNAIGGLLAGSYIHKTGRYKKITIWGVALAAACYAILILRWRGHITVWESLEIFPGGFGSGVTLTTTFIAITSNISPEKIAIATSGLYLSTNIGMVLGVSISSAIQKAMLKSMLQDRLHLPDAQEIIQKTLSDVSYIKHLRGSLHDLIVGTYLESLEYSHGFSLICALAAVVVALVMKEHPIRK